MREFNREVTERELEKLRARLKDPWRLLRNAEQGIDPVLTDAETRSIESMVHELEAQLAIAALDGR